MTADDSRSVKCSTCRQPRGMPCVSRAGVPTRPHRARIVRALAAALRRQRGRAQNEAEVDCRVSVPDWKARAMAVRAYLAGRDDADLSAYAIACILDGATP